MYFSDLMCRFIAYLMRRYGAFCEADAYTRVYTDYVL